MSLYRHGPTGVWSFRVATAGALAVLVVGTLGFMWIESWSVFDAFYMTVITLSTVGFGEVRPLSDAGRFFAACLIVGGVAAVGFALAALGERILDGPRRRNARRIRRMKDHVIVCGYGRIALPVVDGLARRGDALVVIEQEAERVDEAVRAGISAIHGDATAEEVLERAGIRRAATVAALLPVDSANLTITMTATALRPGVRVIARSEDERSRANLERAGAQPWDVVAPHTTAGKAVLRSICYPGTARLLRGLNDMTDADLDAGEIVVDEGSALVGKTLAGANIGGDKNVLVVAIQREGKIVAVAPRGSEVLQSGDTLHLFGHPDDLEGVGAPVSEPESGSLS